MNFIKLKKYRKISQEYDEKTFAFDDYEICQTVV